MRLVRSGVVRGILVFDGVQRIEVKLREGGMTEVIELGLHRSQRHQTETRCLALCT